MDIEQSSVLNVALLLAGLLLLAAPLLAPVEVPDDRVEYYAEADFGDIQGQENLAYQNLSAAEQSVFDTAVAHRPDPVNVSLAESPDSLTPKGGGIDIYNVRYNGSYYALQVKHFTYEADFVTQHLPRLGAIALGCLLLVAAAYRRFAR